MRGLNVPDVPLPHAAGPSPYAFNFADASGEGVPWTPTPYPGYIYDFDGSLRFYRPKLVYSTNPDPATYPNGEYFGMVQGMMPLQDDRIYQTMVGRIPWGPTINQVPADAMRYIGQMTFPELQKTGSQPEDNGRGLF
jgi:hypothetical protein